MAFAAVYRPVSHGHRAVLGAQHTSNAAEMPVAELPNRLSGCWRAIFSSAPICFSIVNALAGDGKECHQPARAGERRGLRIPADNFFRMATLDQLLHSSG